MHKHHLMPNIRLGKNDNSNTESSLLRGTIEYQSAEFGRQNIEYRKVVKNLIMSPS